MRILLYSTNFYPELTGIGKYNGEMIKWLTESGHDCTVVTTFPYYPHWKVQEPYKNKFYKKEKLFNPSVNVIRCPCYIPENPNGFKRILGEVSFIFFSFFVLVRLLFSRRFNLVIAVTPPFYAAYPVSFFKLFHKSIIWNHIQDLQVDTADKLGMIKGKFLMIMLYRLEKFILGKVNFVSSISPGMIKKIKEKINREIIFFPNWSDISKFYQITDPGIRLIEKKQFGFGPDDYIILYSGSIGEKQGLEGIVYAAKELQDNKNLKFVICGSGPYKQKLEYIAHDLAVTNIIFLPLQPFEKLNSFLNIADIHLVIQKENASDLVMPSKLTNILAVGGLALITANRGSYLYEFINSYNTGLLVDSDNLQALKAGICKAISLDANDIKQNARRYAERYLSINNIMSDFVKTLNVGSNKWVD